MLGLCSKKMDITFLGHSSFKIKSSSVTLVTDPFDPKMVGLKFSSQEADIVTISHDHPDHSYLNSIQNPKKIISSPGEYEVSGVSFIGIGSFHDDQKGSLRGKNTIYVIEIEKLRLCHLGDLGHELSESQIEEIGDIDILMIPVGGEYTIDAQKAVEICRALEPNFIIPMHYKIEGLNEETFEKLLPVDEFVKQMGLPSETLPKLSVKEGSFSEEEQKVIILEKK